MDMKSLSKHGSKQPVKGRCCECGSKSRRSLKLLTLGEDNKEICNGCVILLHNLLHDRYVDLLRW